MRGNFNLKVQKAEKKFNKRVMRGFKVRVSKAP